MARFISIKSFSELYSDESDLSTSEGIANFKTKVEGEEGQIIANGLNITPTEFQAFQKTLESPENILFYSWTERNNALTELLLDKKLDSFQDVAGVQKHQLFDKFRRFISPYLSNALLSITVDNMLDRSKAMSFVVLLDEDHSPVVEQSLFKPIQKELKEAYDVLRTSENEQE